MKKHKTLDIKGISLDKGQLEAYMEKIASEHNVIKMSQKNTYPIPILKSNFNIITETYRLLNSHVKLGIPIHSAGEWLLDNYYIIEENYQAILKDLPLNKYRKLGGISGGKYDGFARIYVFATEIVSYTNGKIDEDTIDSSIKAYQKKKFFSMDELWNLGIFIKISLIQSIKDVCERIYSAQIQKEKVESIIERLVEKKSGNIQSFTNRHKAYKIEAGEIRYSFIEYMSFRLKQYGKSAITYQNILEAQVQKMGLTISEIIRREHFYIANLKLTIGNCIKSIKEVNRVSFSDILNDISGTEDVLKMDPVGVYDNMTQDSKMYYRQKIEEISKKTGFSEIYIAGKTLELCQKHVIIDGSNDKSDNIIADKRAHIGYYLLDDGYFELLNYLGYTNKKGFTKNQKAKLYVFSNVIISIVLSLIFSALLYGLIGNILLVVVSFFILLVPISEIVIQLVNYILGKFIKPKMLPKIDFDKGVDSNNATFVVIPTILKNKSAVCKYMKKLEVSYLANKSENLYFALLGDCTAGSKLEEKFDNEVMQEGIKCAKELNEKYGFDGFPKFHFLYRNRVWNEGEKSYIGWERKRGLLYSFSGYIDKKRDNDFRCNTIEDYKDKLPKIKYVITLDADTDLVLNSAFELIGAMSHILNRPIIDEKTNMVVDGYGIMQPRVGVNLSTYSKSLFVQIFEAQGGVDSYTNAIFDVYQDNFGEGIFAGKGIFDVPVYNKILEGQIPENTVLSHDLLEGCYLRCGLLSDVMLLDGYPTKYNAYMMRNHRWIRGDWQIIKWLKSKKLNILSKFKIYDNLRRSLINIMGLIGIFVSMYLFTISNFAGLIVLAISFGAIVMPNIIDIINYIIFKESTIEGAIYAHKKFSGEVSGIKVSLLRGLLSISFIPFEAKNNFDAIVRSIYRMITKKKLLEWTTSEDSEKSAKSSLSSYLRLMFFNVVLGAVLIGIGSFYLGTMCDVFRNPFAIAFGKCSEKHHGIIMLALGMLWCIAPVFAFYVSRNKIDDNKISDENKSYLLDVGKRIWHFFEDNITDEGHFLIPDNYQEDRKEKIVYRTSSTNIGLELMAIISAYDLGYINLEKAKKYILNVIDVIKILTKWNGHLYNWYNTKTLEPLKPQYVSTVDSGNFVGYLYVLKQFMIENKFEKDVIDDVSYIINESDFSKLYSEKNRLLSIGYSLEDNKLTDSYYDFLASESRQASFVAIAKKDIPAKHWNNMSRTLTTIKQFKGLISWSGTAFEYLMPNVNIKRYKGSLLDEASKFLVLSQIEYSKKLGVPWGISESAYNLKDLNNNYQYKAFGIPWLGLKRGLEDDIVISPYSTFLSLMDASNVAIKNLKTLESEGAYNKYGFYESIDYTPSRLSLNKKSAVVKTYMAHHQGLSLLSINNYINNGILQERFHNNPEIESADILLQERMPARMIITKEKKEKAQKPKLIQSSYMLDRVYKKLRTEPVNINFLSSGNYQVCMFEDGSGFSKYKDKLVTSFKVTDDYNQGVSFYIKNTKTKKIFDAYGTSKIVFSPYMSKFVQNYGNLQITTSIVVDSESNAEIRKIELKNNGGSEEIFEITSYCEPILSNSLQEYLHPAFNRLFLRYKSENDCLFFERTDRISKEKLYLGAMLYTESDNIGDFEFEFDKEKFFGRENLDVPFMVSESKSFSKNSDINMNPCLAMKRIIKIIPGETAKVSFVMTVSEKLEDVKENLELLKNNEYIEKSFEVSKTRAEEELKYLRILGEKQVLYQKLLGILLFRRYNCCENNKDRTCQTEQAYLEMDSLWKYGISGDNPILLVKVKFVEDVYILKDVLSFYEYCIAKNIRVDVVIVNEEKDIYEQYVKDGIISVILNKQLGINNGIYLINKNEAEKRDLDTIVFMARIVIDARKGSIENIIKEILQDFQDNKQNSIILNQRKKTYDNLVVMKNKKELVYDNDFGGFSIDGKEYLISTDMLKKLPTVWSHVIGNENFGAIMTENIGGFVWYKNSRLNRITAWNNKPVENIPSEIFYIKDLDTGENWTLNSNVDGNGNRYDAIYGFGYARYLNLYDDVIFDMVSFIPVKESVKINRINLKNTKNIQKNLKLVYYIKPVLGEDESITNGKIEVFKNENMVCFRNVVKSDFGNSISYISGSEKIESFTGNKDEFIGIGNITAPKGIDIQHFESKDGLSINSCIAVEYRISLNPFEAKDICFNLGSGDSIININEQSCKYNSLDNCDEALNEINNYWKEKTNKLKVKTPVKSLDIFLNGWAIYQTIVCRLWSKSGYYQSGGAIGFRDQLQDAIGMKYVDSTLLKNQILKACNHQFMLGDVLHWWHEETEKGIRTRFSDDLLWLVYAVCEYVEYTGDYEFLNEEAYFLEGEELRNGEDERYAIYKNGENKGSILMHCIKAIDRACDFGVNGLPKIGSGDWNDGFNTIGNKGKGESVWLGFFLFHILDRFIPVCEKFGMTEEVIRYCDIKDKLKKSLNSKAWDGRWFRRAFTDNGDVVGSVEADECRIDSISQSWAVISNAGDNDKKFIAMESAEAYLVDEENGIIKLLDPAFENSKIEPGYIKAYPAGIRENGGQYTHAAIWVIMAEAMLGFGDKAVSYYTMINPIEHSKTKDLAKKYKIEPYVLAGDVYSAKGLEGRGGWSWYTGSSSWYYKVRNRKYIGG